MERSKSLYERDLLPRQTFDDTDARYQAAQAQLELSMAQLEQTKSRLDELKINLSNTVIAAPVDGFIGKRTLDPGASVGVNTSFISVVDIRTVRLVINVVEKDLRRIHQGTSVEVEVDAYPGENFIGRVARLAPNPRPGDPHGTGGNRNSQLELPAQARHVRARTVHGREARRRARRAGRWPLSICRAKSGCGCPPTKAILRSSRPLPSESSSRNLRRLPPA
jgi:hypothetical protein